MENSALEVSRSGKQIECNSLQCPLKFLIKETQRRAAADECIPPINSTQNVITWLSMSCLGLFYLSSFAIHLNTKT